MTDAPIRSVLDEDHGSSAAQSPVSGSQALPSASTTNIRALPDAAGEVEPADVPFEVWQDDMMVASADRRGEAEHYAAVYSQDGPVTLKHSVTWRFDGFDAPDHQATVSTLRAEIERLREALAPFAAMATAGDQRPKDDAVWAGQDGLRITYGDFRRAAQALGGSHE